MKEDVNTPKKRLVWRLDVVMAEKKIRTVTDLQRRLAGMDISISTAQLGRIVYERPQRLNTDLLEGIINVLDCTVGDLLRVENAAEEVETTDTVKSKPAQKMVAEPKPGSKPLAGTNVTGQTALRVVEKKSANTPLVLTDEEMTGPKVSSIPRPAIPEKSKKP